MMVNAPDMVRVVRKLNEFASAHPDQVPQALIPVVKQTTPILRHVFEINETETQQAAE